MARKSRLIYPGIPHHANHSVITKPLITRGRRGNNRQEIFLEDGDRHYYLKWMLSLAIDNKVPIIGYCLMTNHIHLLLLPQTVTGLINFMKVLSQRYTQYFNYTYHRTGKLWGNRYKLHPFEPESNSALLRYVERNPLRAGIVDNVIDYPWSSAHYHLTGKFDPYIMVDILGYNPNDYRDFFSLSSADDHQHLTEIRTAVKQGCAYGSEDFIRWLTERLQCIVTPRPKGRPRKTIKSSRKIGAGEKGSTSGDLN